MQLPCYDVEIKLEGGFQMASVITESPSLCIFLTHLICARKRTKSRPQVERLQKSEGSSRKEARRRELKQKDQASSATLGGRGREILLLLEEVMAGLGSSRPVLGRDGKVKSGSGRC